MFTKDKVTGIMVYYYIVCKKKLWYHSKGINMESNSEDVAIGKSIDEEYYKNEEKHVNIRNIINIDYIKEKNIIHEVKKSRVIEEASIMQVKYYIWFLKKENINGVIGIIDYPLLRVTKKVELNFDDEILIESMLEDIVSIISSDFPPDIKKKKICNKCSYFDLCML